MAVNWEQIDPLIRAALEEDAAGEDITTRALIPSGLACRAEVVARQEGIICGLRVAERVCRLCDERLALEPSCADGERVRRDTVVATLSGPARSVLSVERTLLNFLQRMSGIATFTRRWRALDKYAVRCGGGVNHRMGLADQVLIKDNHLALLRRASVPGARGRGAGGALAEAIRQARQHAPGVLVAVEVDSIEALRTALASGPDVVLLDNMTPAEVRQAAELARSTPPPRTALEASGGVTLQNVRQYAEAGAERISIGALTHSAPALDISLRVL